MARRASVSDSGSDSEDSSLSDSEVSPRWRGRGEGPVVRPPPAAAV